MGLGYVEGVTHDYFRHGTTTLFAALNVANGTVIGQCKPRHRHQEFLSFLRHVERNVPADLDVHLIVDNYGTYKHAKVRAWLAKRPGFGNFLPSVVLAVEIPGRRKDTTILENLGDYIRARRHELGLTQRQAAQILKVNRVTLWYWENHRTEPEIGLYPRIADFLGYCPYHCCRSFAELLWLHRAYRGLSKEKMARWLGVHPDTLSQWEQGVCSPTFRSVERIAGILGLPKLIRYR